jgi:hypothetical protein
MGLYSSPANAVVVERPEMDAGSGRSLVKHEECGLVALVARDGGR